jgi:ApaG protein
MALVRNLYRAFLREAKRMESAGERLALVEPLRIEDASKYYGRASFTLDMPPGVLQRTYFPNVPFAELGLADATHFSASEMRELVGRLFRKSPTLLSPSDAIKYPSTLNRLRASAMCHTETETVFAIDMSVRVKVSTIFLPTFPIAALAAASHWPHCYRVRVKNSGTEAVQLVGRTWEFRDTRGGSIVVPRGSPGVVGQVPRLEPGQTFTYFSGVQLNTSSGVMEGSLQMKGRLQAKEQTSFDAVIRPTLLGGPSLA